MAAERATGSHGQSRKVSLELSSDCGSSRCESLIHTEADYEINWKAFTKSSSHQKELIFSVCVGGHKKRMFTLRLECEKWDSPRGKQIWY